MAKIHLRVPNYRPKPTRQAPKPKDQKDKWLRSTLVELIGQGRPLTARQLAEETSGNPDSVIDALSSLYVAGQVQRRQVYNPTYASDGRGQLNCYQYLPKGQAWPKLSAADQPR
mgnify:CR=1 FL=1